MSFCSLSRSARRRSKREERCADAMPFSNAANATAPYWRISGLESRTQATSSGRRAGTYGTSSLPSITSPHMFPTTMDARRLNSSLRSLRPRARTGTMMARHGRSMALMNVTSISCSMHGVVLSPGEMMASMSGGTMAFISGLWISSIPSVVSAFCAAVCTSGLVSVSVSTIAGTSTCTTLATCLGATFTFPAMALRHATLACQLTFEDLS
mmetsp:Transcript_39696/g.81300  ORF Transcript_39696/g.81300 Transcript_39696/m.81300 type:complete len:211 (-) Transcript_39696:914-1546(-)